MYKPDAAEFNINESEFAIGDDTYIDLDDMDDIYEAQEVDAEMFMSATWRLDDDVYVV